LVQFTLAILSEEQVVLNINDIWNQITSKSTKTIRLFTLCYYLYWNINNTEIYRT